MLVRNNILLTFVGADACSSFFSQIYFSFCQTFIYLNRAFLSTSHRVTFDKLRDAFSAFRSFCNFSVFESNDGTILHFVFP